MSGSCLNGQQIKLLNLAKAFLNILLNFCAGVDKNLYKSNCFYFPLPFCWAPTKENNTLNWVNSSHSCISRNITNSDSVFSWNYFFPLKLKAPLKPSNFNTYLFFSTGWITYWLEMPQQLWVLVVCHGITFLPLCFHCSCVSHVIALFSLSSIHLFMGLLMRFPRGRTMIPSSVYPQFLSCIICSKILS